MKMSLVVEGLRSDALAVGELGDDIVAEVAERIAAVLARSASSRILDLLSDLPEGRVEIHLAGDDVELAYVDEEKAAAETDAELSARITLRLPDQLKTRVEESAAREGISVNGWVLRALDRGTSASKARSGRPGSRLRGYGTS
jgi:predicted DNA binding CopG/RHH family protein